METATKNGLLIDEIDTDMQDEATKPDELVLEHRVNGDFWKWVAMGLLSVVMLMLGGFVQHLLTNDAVQDHSALPGHPLMQERVETIQENMRELKVSIEAMDEKLDDIKESIR